MSIFRSFLLLLSLCLSHSSFSSTKFESCMSKDCIQLFKDFKKYARHDMPIAMEALGNFYMNGYGVEINQTKALRYYEHTAKYGSESAQYKTGLMYLLGMGQDQDVSRGITWLRWSVKNGYNKAAYLLGTLYLKGEYIEQDIDKAIHWLEISSKKDDAQSQFLLAQIYEQEQFGNKDISKAIELYSQSAFKVEGSAKKLEDLHIPLPKHIEQDDGIEHIEVNPLPFLELMALKLAGLKNYETPTTGTGTNVISPSCRNAKINCGKVGILSDPVAIQRFIYDTRHASDAEAASRL